MEDCLYDVVNFSGRAPRGSLEDSNSTCRYVCCPSSAEASTRLVLVPFSGATVEVREKHHGEGKGKVSFYSWQSSLYGRQGYCAHENVREHARTSVRTKMVNTMFMHVYDRDTPCPFLTFTPTLTGTERTYEVQNSDFLRSPFLERTYVYVRLHELLKTPCLNKMHAVRGNIGVGLELEAVRSAQSIGGSFVYNDNLGDTMARHSVGYALDSLDSTL